MSVPDFLDLVGDEPEWHWWTTVALNAEAEAKEIIEENKQGKQG
jgi:hypothetical protein